MSLSQPAPSSDEVMANDSPGDIGWRGAVGYTIVLALLFSTLTGLGPYRAIVGLGLIYVIHAVVTGRYSLLRIPRPHLLLYLALISLWLVSQLYPTEIINHRAVKNILYALVVAATINVLPRFEWFNEQGRKRIIAAFVLVVSGAVIGHVWVLYKEEAVAVSQLYFDRSLMFDGLFDNIHFLGLFCCFSLPALLVGWAWFRCWPARFAVAIIISLDLALLLASSSRPAWLTVAVVTMLGLLILLPKKRAWSVIAVIGVAIWGLVKLNLFGVGARVTNFTSNFMEEERIVLWGDTLTALRNSSVNELMLGHGIGSYAYYSPSFSSDRALNFLVFPHNFFLEWLFEVGVAGFLVITIGLGYVMVDNLLSQTIDVKLRRCQIIVGLTLMAVLLHGFFVLPFFYARQILFLVTILVCLSFVFNEKAPTRVG